MWLYAYKATSISETSGMTVVLTFKTGQKYEKSEKKNIYQNASALRMKSHS